MFIQVNSLTELVRDHDSIFPITECVHITSFALSVGTIAATDFSLLGIGFPRKTAPQVLHATEFWTITGFVFIFFSGIVLFSSDPDHYYLNLDFQIKMALLVLALFFNYSIHRRVVLAPDGSRGIEKLVAVVSLMLWAGVVFCGLFFAFT